MDITDARTCRERFIFQSQRHRWAKCVQHRSVLVWLTVDGNVRSCHSGPFPVGPVCMPNCSSSSYSSAVRQQSPGNCSVQSRSFYTSRRLQLYAALKLIASSRRTLPDTAAHDTTTSNTVARDMPHTAADMPTYEFEVTGQSPPTCPF